MRQQACAIVICLTLVLLAGTGSAGAAGLLIADGGFGGVLEIEEHAVVVTINNGIAVTEVTQVFRNTEKRQVEALYTFPVPKGASVANFSMWINGKEMVGEVVEKERARQIYDSYKQRRRDPGLLEQTSYKTFEMRIFPIGPEAEQRVQITYYQELEIDDSWATYVYPLATVTRSDLDSRTRGRFALDLNASSEIPIVAMESPSHADDFAVVEHDPHYFQASLESSGGDLNRDLVLAFRLSRPHTGIDIVPSIETGEDGYFLLTLTVGDNELKAVDSAMDYVFVLDVSGSMNQEGKLALSRSSIGAFMRELGGGDRFELLAFNVAPVSLFDSLRSADEQAISEAMDFLESQRARGGTVLRPAIEAAYRYQQPDRMLNVVILSDGMTEQQERVELHKAIAGRPEGTRVFAIGVGNEVNKPLLEQITEDAGGLAAFISRGDDFSRQANAFRRKLLRPAAANIELDFQGGGVYDLEPQQLPDLFHGSPLRLYGRYRQGGEVAIHFTAEVGGEMINHWLKIELPARAENPEIERMWAWHRVNRLLKEADRTGSRSSVVDEIVRLGEAYSIVTEHTSFLVLENDAEYQRWQIKRRNALRIERDRRKQAEVQTELARLRDRSLAGLGPTAESGGSEQKLAAIPEPLSGGGGSSPAINPAAPGAAPPATRPQAQPQRERRGRDFSLGGGALDPTSVLLVVGLAVLGLAGLWRRGL
jgi:Ca-activated chloride channel family protein